MKHIIFYSWQSDLPNPTNRAFIESVIEKAIKSISNFESCELELSLDKDTKGISGSPNISQVIFDKIKKCDVFVADISIVTGIKSNDERPSPNPNVLLELGYAIALLGWERIFLFYNSVNGAGENLPFDIRQHRRIQYELKADDPTDSKSKQREVLAKKFESELIGMLKNKKRNSMILDVSWNYVDVYDSDNITTSKKIPLSRATNNISETLCKLKEELQLVQNIDGSIDPKWNKKKDNYINEVEYFKKQLNDEDKKRNYLISNNRGKILEKMTLLVKNNGNRPASDIRVELPLPEWLFAFEKYPSNDNIPVKPNMPTPTSPTQGFKYPFKSSPHTNSGYPYLGLINRTQGCYLEKNVIHLWANDLLHKHSISIEKDRFTLLALPDAPIGEHILKGKIFCSEYEDWREIELSVEITQ